MRIVFQYRFSVNSNQSRWLLIVKKPFLLIAYNGEVVGIIVGVGIGVGGKTSSPNTGV